MTLADLFKADNFYALSFDEARSELERCTYAYLGIFPLQKGERPQTDGKRIFLEARKSEFQDDKEQMHNNRNMSLYLSDLLHELLHIREGSFLVDARPYLETFQNRGLAHAVFNIVEDARIENNAQQYIKTEDTELLQRSNEYLARKRQFPEKTQDRFMEIYSSYMITKGKPSQFNSELQEVEQSALETRIEENGLNAQGINTVADLVREVVSISNGVYNSDVTASWEVVPKVYDMLTRAFPNIEQEFPDQNSPYAQVSSPQMQENGEKGKEKKGQKGKSKGNKAKSGSDVKEKGDSNSKDNGQSSDGQSTATQQMAYMGYRGDVHDFSAGTQKGNKLEAMVGDKKEKKNADKDGETNNGVYGVGPDRHGSGKPPQGLVQIVTYDDLKKAYIHLANLKLAKYDGNNPSFLRELDKYDGIRRRIVEHFEMLRPNELQRIQFTEDPDELNMEAVIEVLADPALRTKARAYDSHIINERDSLTSILLDISGSTSGTLESGKRVIDVEKLSAGLVYQSLREIGDEVDLYAFSTDNKTTNLYHLFGLENLGALEPEHANADGVAIRGVVAEMKGIDARDKTLLVISDGKPVATGYKGDPVIDTSMAFGEAEAQGIRTVYFNVDNAPSDYFDTLVRNTTYAQSLKDVEQLPEVVSDFVMENV